MKLERETVKCSCCGRVIWEKRVNSYLKIDESSMRPKKCLLRIVVKLKSMSFFELSKRLNQHGFSAGISLSL